MEKKKSVIDRRIKKDASQIAKNIVDMVTNNGNESNEIPQESDYKYFEGKPVAKISSGVWQIPISELKGL